ncbi:hypothetical protein FQZ97_1153480 [compost metagenome]
MALVADADLGQQRLGPLQGFGLAQTEHPARRLDDVIEHAHVRPQIEILKDETQLAAQAVDLLAIGGDQVAVLAGLELEFFAGDDDLPLIGVFQQIDAAQEGRLAGTG